MDMEERLLKISNEVGFTVEEILKFKNMFTEEQLFKLYEQLCLCKTRNNFLKVVKDQIYARISLFEMAEQEGINIYKYKGESNGWLATYITGYPIGIDKYVDIGLSDLQFEEVMIGLSLGVDVSEYANKWVPHQMMQEIRLALYYDNIGYSLNCDSNLKSVWDVKLLKHPNVLLDGKRAQIYFKGILVKDFRLTNANDFGTYSPRFELYSMCLPKNTGNMRIILSGLTYEDWVVENEDFIDDVYSQIGINKDVNEEWLKELYIKCQMRDNLDLYRNDFNRG